ncbi:hypothetical protein EV189_3765 [Motilibacter rhizosphaerae]|uniref:Uncharacterized protein n=1 Tax=Motilibacter rhizosphaerae TaxID=598652 RepID=A0A4Q7NAC5_9ACTN|nr:hypothetical protein [Motilibacter rhizosphaerae]RZS79411.1 hypothetical protein EV189_3765 [Motilibacter rhizosphaerae]
MTLTTTRPRTASVLGRTTVTDVDGTRSTGTFELDASAGSAPLPSWTAATAVAGEARATVTVTAVLRGDDGALDVHVEALVERYTAGRASQSGAVARWFSVAVGDSASPVLETTWHGRTLRVELAFANGER